MQNFRQIEWKLRPLEAQEVISVDRFIWGFHKDIVQYRRRSRIHIIGLIYCLMTKLKYRLPHDDVYKKKKRGSK